MKSLLLLSLTAAVFAAPAVARATSCWEITGWSGGLNNQAQVVPADCTRVPAGSLWATPLSSTGLSPTDELWFLLDAHDPQVVGGQIDLLYWGMTVWGEPTVTVHPSAAASPLLPWPPEQGTPAAGDHVRLRHAMTDHCMAGSQSNGGSVVNDPCADAPAQTYVLDDAGGGLFRLRHEATSRCLYALSSGQTLRSYTCWADPNMRFQLQPFEGGFRLRHTYSDPDQCPYGNPMPGGVVHTWSCWDDSNMAYYVDILE